MGNHISTHIHLRTNIHFRKKKHHFSSRKSDSYSYIDGRKYFNIQEDSIYPLPVDNEECDRSQIQHFLFHHVWKENFNSPVKSILERGGKVLDIGCGPGTWLLEMATEYPRTQFVGVDMIPIFPTEIKPYNLNFKRYNILDGLPFGDNEFDLVYIQNSSICFTETQWKEIVIPEMVRVTKLDGWVELMEVEPKIKNTPKNFEQLCNAFIKYGKSHNVNLEIAPHLGDILRNHSSDQLTDFRKDTRKLLHYENIEDESKNSNNKLNKAGKLSKENVMLFYHTISPIILPILGITQKEYDEIVDSVNIEFEKNKCFNDMYRFCARKKSNKKN